MSASMIRRIFAVAAILLLGCSLSGCFYPGYGYAGGDGHYERDHRGDGGDNRDGGGNYYGGGSPHRQGEGN